MNWYLEVLKKYAVFSGRARRKEYWYFILFNIIIYIVPVLVTIVTATPDSSSAKAGIELLKWPYGLYTLAILIPGLP
jgi:uncharacterized membrane protein YhaH (DUF805 family)